MKDIFSGERFRKLGVSDLLRVVGPRVRFWLIMAPVIGIVATGVEFLFAKFIQQFIARLSMPLSTTGVSVQAVPDFEIGQLALGLIVLGGLRSFLQFATAQSAANVHEGTNEAFRKRVLSEILDYRRKEYIPASSTYHFLSEVFPKGAQALYYLAQAIPHLLVAFFIATALIYYSINLGLISLVGIVLIGLIMLRINRATKRYAREVPLEQRKLLAGIERITRNWLLVRVLRTQTWEFEQINKNIASYAKHSIGAYKYSNAAAAIPQVLGSAMVALIAIVSIDYKMIDQALILSFMYLFFRLTQTLSAIGNYGGAFVVLFPQFRATCHYAVNCEKMKTLPQEECLQADSTTAFEKYGPPTIKVQNVSFEYPTGSKAISNLTVTFHGGQQTGIVGRSGSGKSTLLCLLLGVFECSEGKITIDELSPQDFCSRMSNRIGYVGADSFLVEGTLKDNLDYGLNFKATKTEYIKALATAGITTLGGFSEVEKILSIGVHADGSSLSSGQRQRICLARAFLRKPDLLVLDEATANLDIETEKSILGALDSLKGDVTVLIVSHKSETLKGCEQIINLV